MSGPTTTNKSTQSGSENTTVGATGHDVSTTGGSATGVTNNMATGTTSGTSVLNPYAGAVPGLQNVLSGATNLQQSNYGVPQLESLGLGLLGGYGFGEGRGGINETFSNVNSAFNPILNGSLDPNSNPATAQLISQITDQARNNVGDSWAGAGRSFSPGAAAATAKATTEGLAPLLFGQYNTNVQNRLNAGNALNSAAVGRSSALDASRSGALGAAGMVPGIVDQIRGMPAADLARQLGLILPIASQFGTTSNYGNTAGSNYGTTADSTYGTTTEDTNKTIQTLMENYMTGKSKSSQSGGEAQMGIGAAIGLAGLLSDRRAKRDIERVGSLDNGLPIYRFRYLDSDAVHIGLMADEVEMVTPEAVAVGHDGLKRVDYMRATQ